MINNDVVEYLNKYFTDATLVTEAHLDSHFLTKFGVNVSADKSGTNRWLFNYDQLAVKWSFPLSHYCRGIICTFENGIWSVVSWPYNKFFNFHEPNCPITKFDYEQSPSLYRLLSKEDGTYIQVYLYNKQWCVSTRGTITTMEVNGTGMTFEGLWWDTVQKDTGLSKEEFCKLLGSDPATYIFELCTPFNRIVSRYATPRVYLIGLRELKYGRLMTHGELDEEARRIGLRRPKFLFCNDLDSHDKLIAFVEQDSLVMDAHDPEYKEGFVMYDGCKPIAKLKNQKYLLLHSIMGGHDEIYTIKNIVRCYLAGTIDDVYAALPEQLQRGADQLKIQVTTLIGELVGVVEEINKVHKPEAYADPKEEQKQYALLITKLLPAACGDYSKYASGYFFMNKKKIIDGLLGDFSKYLQDSCEKQIDYWKKIVKLSAFN